MPSPFPGMDPYIERDDWRDFHLKMLGEISAQLVPQLRPRYTLRVEERVTIDSEGGLPSAVIPDATVWEHVRETHAPYSSSGRGAAVIELPIHEPERERYLAIRHRESQSLVTLIEVLSPTNKQGAGRRDYLAKRGVILATPAHLVEIDLLRGGAPMPAIGEVPEHDYSVMISRAEARPQAEVIYWQLPDRLPAIAIPVVEGDSDRSLDLQLALDSVYDRSGYDYSLDYRVPAEPILTSEQQAWIEGLLVT